jgi:hypothetical protein
MYIVHIPGSSQFIFMLFPMVISFIFLLVYLVTQIILLNKRKSRLIKTKVFLSIIGISFVCLSVFAVSLIRNPAHQKLFLDFWSGHVNYSLLHLARVILDAEGLDIFLCFVLALISGQKLYSQRAKFDIRGFFVALLAWLLIMSTKELIHHFLPFREGDVLDIVKNMIGGILPGLALSTRWFWRK